nr:hypothetical protein CFP56_72681 [Quercus suber]
MRLEDLYCTSLSGPVVSFWDDANYHRLSMRWWARSVYEAVCIAPQSSYSDNLALEQRWTIVSLAQQMMSLQDVFTLLHLSCSTRTGSSSSAIVAERIKGAEWHASGREQADAALRKYTVELQY